MFEELVKNLNKSVSLTLINGKEREGTIVGIDAETNTIRLRENTTGKPISILISMIGMVESTEETEILYQTPVIKVKKQEPPIAVLNLEVPPQVSPQETLVVEDVPQKVVAEIPISQEIVKEKIGRAHV